MDHHGAQIIRDVVFAISATIMRLYGIGSENALRAWMRLDSNMDRSIMGNVLKLALSNATTESLQSLPPHSYPDRDPTHYIGWEPSRYYAVHRSLLSLSFLLRDIRVDNIRFDPEELMERMRETREALDEAHFRASSYPLAYNDRIDFVRSSLRAILVSANLMRPPPQALRRYLGTGATLDSQRQSWLTLQPFKNLNAPSARWNTAKTLEPGNEIVHLPCDERHIFHAQCIALWLKQDVSCPACRVKFR